MEEGYERKTLQWAAEQLEQLRKPELAGRAYREEEQHMEPRYQLDKDSICYGCQHYKAVEDCGRGAIYG